MNEAFFFEASPWELYLEKIRKGKSLSAAQMLALLEGESEEAVEEAFDTLEQLGVTPVIDDLPFDNAEGDTGKRLALENKLYRARQLLTGLPEGDPLLLYLQEIAGLPACGDEDLLAEELARANQLGTDAEALQTRLVNLSLSRVVELAGEFMGRGVLLLDLIQEGSMGLWKGILVYNGQEKFSRFRDWWIRFYMTRALTIQARENGLGAKLRKGMEGYRDADRRLLAELGHNPSLEEIARDMGITPQEAQTYEDMLRNARILEKAHAPKAEPTQEDEQAVEDTAYFQSRQRILDMLSTLSETEAQVLTLRFGLEGGLPMSAADTAQKLGISADAVAQLEADALTKLRNT